MEFVEGNAAARCKVGPNPTVDPSKWDVTSTKLSDIEVVRAKVDDTVPVVDPATSAWTKGKPVYSLTMLALGIIVSGSFTPAVVAWFMTGTWYMNVVLRDFVNPFQRLISAHAISALLMLAMIIAQVYTGITGSRAPSGATITASWASTCSPLSSLPRVASRSRPKWRPTCAARNSAR